MPTNGKKKIISDQITFVDVVFDELHTRKKP